MHTLAHTIKRGALVLLIALLSTPVCAWDRDERLAIMAVDLLPAILGAQKDFPEYYLKDIAAKTVTVTVLFHKKQSLAEQVEARLRDLKPVKGIQLVPRLMRVEAYLQQPFMEKPPIGHVLFLAETPDNQLNRLLAQATRYQDVSYSPYFSDVERGAALGLSVTDRVLPVINQNVTQQLNMRFSDLFMRIARQVSGDG